MIRKPKASQFWNRSVYSFQNRNKQRVYPVRLNEHSYPYPSTSLDTSLTKTRGKGSSHPGETVQTSRKLL